MKYFVPEVEVSINDGFKPELDIFERKSIGVSLARLVEQSDQSLVISLDNNWGEGKSTFLKMWQGYLKKGHDINSIYFDAFANDHIDDPFSALLGELYSFISEKLPESSPSKQEFKEKAKKAGVAILKGGLKVAVRYFTMNTFDGTSLDGNNQDSNKIDKAVADEIVNLSESTVQNYLNNYSKAKTEIEDFKTILENVVKEISPNQPLVFIVDELDRCKPSYSVELLEKLKHVFSVPGVHFVLSVNRKQLEASVKGIYGSEIDACLYIQKFIHLSLSLPMTTEYSSSHQRKYSSNLAERSEIGNDREAQNVIGAFINLAEHMKLSFRDCEKIFSVLMIQVASGSSGLAMVMTPLAVIQVLNPELFKRICSDDIELIEIENILAVNVDKYQNDINEWVSQMYLRFCYLFSVSANEQPSTDFERDYLNFTQSEYQNHLEYSYNRARIELTSFNVMS